MFRQALPLVLLVLSLPTLSGCRFVNSQMSAAFPTQAPGTQPAPSRQPTPPAKATTDGSISHADFADVARLVIDRINSARVEAGLGALLTDATLTRIAADRSADLINRDYFSHSDPQTGRELFSSLLQSNRYSYQLAGENLAEIENGAGWVPPFLTVGARYSETDLANEFVRGWLDSPDHRANILNARFRRTGVGVAMSQDGRRVVATQTFSN